MLCVLKGDHGCQMFGRTLSNVLVTRGLGGLSHSWTMMLCRCNRSPASVMERMPT